MGKKRWVIISPHFDDAVLSIGGLIWELTRKGTPVEIWTLQAGFAPAGPLSDFANRLHADWGFSSAAEAVTLRRIEDQNAASTVGAVVRHFPNPDCIYRRDSAGTPIYTEDVFIPPVDQERDLPDQLAGQIRIKLKAADTVLCPLTVGGHVDHLLARMAAERMGRDLVYYAEIPYILNHPDELPAKSQGLAAEYHPVSEAGLTAWQNGIAEYKSQIPLLFKGGFNEMRQAMEAYWAKNKGVFLWKSA